MCSKNLKYLQLIFVKLFCKYDVILAEHRVASHTSSDITSGICFYKNSHKHILEILHTNETPNGVSLNILLL
jgi:hypothetical protein